MSKQKSDTKPIRYTVIGDFVPYPNFGRL